ncbi:hypothetical protein EYF80_008638 [Liparis tanakae]|uniref:Uncharacterized protein n=1 Tax=Liparis tanakae TaxID=230148 RepID=A0A4Z2IUK5_9TELE|nr:hypothetical protein EYF80_008638 [Liparis tanakae]
MPRVDFTATCFFVTPDPEQQEHKRQRPWLVSQEATLLLPVSSGMDGGLSSSVPLADALNPSLLS